jgi:hypothetical protein
MIDFQERVDKLQNALGIKNPLTDKNCTDKIDEKMWWEHVLPALNEISIKTANELQNETGKFYPKDSYLTDTTGKIVGVKSVKELEKVTGKLDLDDILLTDINGIFVGVRRRQKYSEAPPTRLLSMTLNLSYWLGFLDTSGDHEMHKEAIGAKERIIKAYESGKASHSKSKSNQSNA